MFLYYQEFFSVDVYYAVVKVKVIDLHLGYHIEDLL